MHLLRALCLVFATASLGHALNVPRNASSLANATASGVQSPGSTGFVSTTFSLSAQTSATPSVGTASATKSSNVTYTTYSQPTPTNTCCYLYPQGVGVNTWWSSINLTVATVITTWLQYNNTLIPGNSTTITATENLTSIYGTYQFQSVTDTYYSSFDPTTTTYTLCSIYANDTGDASTVDCLKHYTSTATYYSYLSSSAEIVAGIPNTLLPSQATLYGLTAVGPYTAVTFPEQNLTIHSPTPFFQYPGIELVTSWQCATQTVYTDYTDYTFVTSSGNLVEVSTVLPRYTTTAFASDDDFPHPGEFDVTINGIIIEPFPPGDYSNFNYTAYMDETGGVQGEGSGDDDILYLPSTLPQFLAAIPSVKSQMPDIAQCSNLIAEGEPTVHVPVNRDYDKSNGGVFAGDGTTSPTNAVQSPSQGSTGGDTTSPKDAGTSAGRGSTGGGGEQTTSAGNAASPSAGATTAAVSNLVSVIDQATSSAGGSDGSGASEQTSSSGNIASYIASVIGAEASSTSAAQTQGSTGSGSSSSSDSGSDSGSDAGGASSSRPGSGSSSSSSTGTSGSGSSGSDTGSAGSSSSDSGSGSTTNTGSSSSGGSGSGSDTGTAGSSSSDSGSGSTTNSGSTSSGGTDSGAGSGSSDSGSGSNTGSSSSGGSESGSVSDTGSSSSGSAGSGSGSSGSGSDSAVVSVGSSSFTVVATSQAGGSSVVLVANGGSTATLTGGSATTFAGQVISAPSAGGAIIGSGSSAATVAPAQGSQDLASSATVVNIAGQTFTAVSEGSGGVVLQNSATTATVAAGSSANINGEAVSAPSSGGIVVGTGSGATTIEIGSSPAETSPVLSAGGQQFTQVASSSGDLVFENGQSSFTVSAGGAAVTAAGQTISLGSSGVAVLNGVTTSLSGQTTGGVASTGTLVVGNSAVAVTALGSSAYVIDGQTVSNGGEITYNGQTISVASTGGAVVIGGSTTEALPGPTGQSSDSGASSVFTFGSETITASAAANGQDVINVGSETVTLSPGGAAATIGSQVISEASDGAIIAASGAQTTTVTLAQPTEGSGVLTAGSQTVGFSQVGSDVVVGGKTLAPGSTVVIDGETVSLNSQTQVVVVSGPEDNVSSTLEFWDRQLGICGQLAISNEHRRCWEGATGVNLLRDRDAYDGMGNLFAHLDGRE
ncbi:hypothetical protein LTR85_010885 [Meristemomyces frigidus]|nr:hypothetical protein LTR85_010885 [Meristemomyces frigidus]